ETGLIIAAVGIAAYMRLGVSVQYLLQNENGALKAVLIAGVTQVCLYYCDLYDARILSNRRELFTRMVQALASASFTLAVLYFWFPRLIIGRGVFIIAALLIIAFVNGWRVAFEWLSRRMRPRERLLLVGTGSTAIAFSREMFGRRHDLGVEIVGFVDTEPSRAQADAFHPDVIGPGDDIPSIVRPRRVDPVDVLL